MWQIKIKQMSTQDMKIHHHDDWEDDSTIFHQFNYFSILGIAIIQILFLYLPFFSLLKRWLLNNLPLLPTWYTTVATHEHLDTKVVVPLGSSPSGRSNDANGGRHLRQRGRRRQRPNCSCGRHGRHGGSTWPVRGWRHGQRAGGIMHL